MSIPAQGAVGAETMTAGQSLDLRDLHAANIARQAEWCPDQVPDLSFRGNELGGECGEAQNVIKKLERERQGWRGSRATKDDLADELADVVICADLCAVTADIDLGAAVRRKFNATSEKQGLSVFLPLPALASPRADSDERTAGVLWFAWSEDDCDSDPRIDPMAQKVTEWFVGRWPVGAEEPECRILIGEGRSAEIIARRIADNLTSILNTDVIRARKAATPAQPAGAVPDSLREALEFYATQWNADCDAVLIGPGVNDWSGGSVGYEATEALSKDAGARARKALRSLASHPAGQSAGSGAKPCAWAGGNDTCYCRTCGEEYRYGREDKPACPRNPAPDSTRTGQAEETVAVPASALRWLFGDGPDADGVWFGDQLRGKGAFWWRSEFRKRIEAARPAAREAQGAEIKVDVPVMRLSDGRADYYVRITCGGREVTPYKFAERYKAEYEAAHFAWIFGLRPDEPDLLAYYEASYPNVPAPPASSGQGGR